MKIINHEKTVGLLVRGDYIIDDGKVRQIKKRTAHPSGGHMDCPACFLWTLEFTDGTETGRSNNDVVTLVYVVEDETK